MLAYGGSRPLEAVASHRHIRIHHLPEPPAWTSSTAAPPSSPGGGGGGGGGVGVGGGGGGGEGGGRRSSPSPPSASDSGGGLVRVLALVVKALLQLLSLLYATLWVLPRPKGGILAQTPPALPTLPALAVAARLRGARLVVDWHNFAFTIMSLSMGRRHPLVRGEREGERRGGGGGRQRERERKRGKERKKREKKAHNNKL